MFYLVDENPSSLPERTFHGPHPENLSDEQVISLLKELDLSSEEKENAELAFREELDKLKTKAEGAGLEPTLRSLDSASQRIRERNIPTPARDRLLKRLDRARSAIRR